MGYNGLARNNILTNTVDIYLAYIKLSVILLTNIVECVDIKRSNVRMTFVTFTIKAVITI